MKEYFRTFNVAMLLSAGLAGLAEAEPAVVHLKAGQVQRGELVRVTATGTELRTASGGAATIVFDHRSVDRVDFPASPAWEKAMTLFWAKDFGKAAVDLEAIARDRSPRTYYPAPGNFATLAERRLLDCYREMVSPERLAPVARRIEWDRLPAREGQVREMVEVWAAVGEGKWSAAQLAAERMRTALAVGDERLGEIAYLEGVALEGLGKPEEALLAYGRVIGVYPGAVRHLAQDGIERSAKLLEATGKRQRERDALLMIYAKSFGGGKLWAGAPREWGLALENALSGNSGN